MMIRVLTGLDMLLEDPGPILGKRIGLVTNHAAVSRDLRHGVKLLSDDDRWELVTLFGPEHGIWGEAQDMDSVGSGTDPVTGLTVHSLYGKTEADLAPRAEQLGGLDALVIDLQDVGSRYYTFVYTMAICMKVAAKNGVPVIVLDRPNPITGSRTEGNVLDLEWKSFVGMYALPPRHGMTSGELAQYFNETEDLGCEVTVVRMKGWSRKMWWDATGLPWVLPSPNMPTLDTATVYSGMCLVEGTNLSEGRGTTRPFEIFGAPWLDSTALADGLNALGMPGVGFRPHWFRPTFQKHSGVVCGGVQIHVTDRDSFEPYRTALWAIKVARDLDPKRFDWREEVYEFVGDRLAIDLLVGTDTYRKILDGEGELAPWCDSWKDDSTRFRASVENCSLYQT